jgi:hypothetical protein
MTFYLRINLFLALPILLFGVAYPPRREPIAPFINGDTFRYHCDHAYDELARLNPMQIRNGDIIFINGDFAEQFFTSIHSRIRSKYVLVSHNTDYPLPDKFAYVLDDERLLAWFTQNPDGTVHPKLYPLPIGVRNRSWEPQNKEILTKYRAMNLPKIHLAYCNFTSQTYPAERNLVFQICSTSPYCFCSTWKDFDSYARDLASSKFVIAPRGNGLDTHRLWEALYAGSIPVTKTSSLDPLLEGLPVVILQDWSELSEEFLNQKYEEMKETTYAMDKLSADFYFFQMDSYKGAQQ